MTAPAPGSQITCDYVAYEFSNWKVLLSMRTISQPNFADAIAEKYGAPV